MKRGETALPRPGQIYTRSYVAQRITTAARHLAAWIELGERAGLSNHDVAELLADDELRAIYMDPDERLPRPDPRSMA